MSITDIGANAAEASRQEREEREASDEDEITVGDLIEDGTLTDVTGLAWVKQHPTTSVGGTAVGLRYFPDWDNDQPDRGYYGLVLDDPYVVADDGMESTIYQNTEEGGDDYKIVDESDEGTKILEGSGVDFEGNMFYGEQVDAFEDDRIVLKLTGGAGRSVASTLDVQGDGGAHAIGAYEDEEVELHGGGFPRHSGHLIEYHPDGRDGEAPRNAVHSELRPDVEGEEVVVMLQRLAEIDDEYDGNSYWSTVFTTAVETDDPTDIDGTEMGTLEPTNEFERNQDIIRATGYIKWNRASLEALNEARAEEGLDPYQPEE